MMPTGRTVADEWAKAQDDAARREMLNEFEVKVVLHSRKAAQRFAITGMQFTPPQV